MKLTVGTRGSKLSLIQTDEVIRMLKRINSDLEIEKRVIRTSGDNEVSKPLNLLGVKGIFEKQIDKELVDGGIDFAVHSFKDVPSDFHHGLTIVAVPKRKSPNDVLISKGRLSLRELPGGSVIGTSSMRRKAQVKRLRSDIDVKSVRGNVETRIGRVGLGTIDGVIVAEAGVRRLKLTSFVSEKLSVTDFVPAAGQGAIAIMARSSDLRVMKLLSIIDDSITRAQVTAESQLILRLKGGCRAAIGALARPRGKNLELQGSIYSIDGRKCITASIRGDVTNPIEIGNEVAEELLRLGAKYIMRSWRT